MYPNPIDHWPSLFCLIPLIALSSGATGSLLYQPLALGMALVAAPLALPTINGPKPADMNSIRRYFGKWLLGKLQGLPVTLVLALASWILLKMPLFRQFVNDCFNFLCVHPAYPLSPTALLPLSTLLTLFLGAIVVQVRLIARASTLRERLWAGVGAWVAIAYFANMFVAADAVGVLGGGFGLIFALAIDLQASLEIDSQKGIWPEYGPERK